MSHSKQEFLPWRDDDCRPVSEYFVFGYFSRIGQRVAWCFWHRVSPDVWQVSEGRFWVWSCGILTSSPMPSRCSPKASFARFFLILEKHVLTNKISWQIRTAHVIKQQSPLFELWADASWISQKPFFCLLEESSFIYPNLALELI